MPGRSSKGDLAATALGAVACLGLIWLGGVVAFIIVMGSDGHTPDLFPAYAIIGAGLAGLAAFAIGFGARPWRNARTNENGWWLASDGNWYAPDASPRTDPH
jgi:hypothetical protein